MSARTPDISDILGQIQRPEKTVPICLRGDLQAEFEELERALKAARDRPSEGTLAGGGAEAAAVAQQIMDLQEQMREHTTVFRFRGLSSKGYSDLVAQHPPTDEDKEKNQDTNWATFTPALVAACAVSPTMTVEDAGQLADALTQAQWDALAMAAFSVNKRDIDIPFSFAASAVLQNSKKNSK
ncbi:hypothetical protein HS041_12340 [Planomonospora sp. ID67723]|uniref:hypothetical protein n=1 Tax=Planomonospora sp. ID67723 TaxID=2738134 RepID=UPI0018C4285B|nr:hypothetical protein [Planomonospora sp. ID67723]MBG0828558.1 hypothetical protein [Planomonospora sp. ID67723]